MRLNYRYHDKKIAMTPLSVILFMFILLVTINLECSIHACAGNILGVLAKPYTRGSSSVVVHNLQFVPLLAEIHPDVRPSNCKVGTTGVKAKIPHFIPILQLKSFEILQFPQIPQFYTGIISSSSQVVSILREG